MSESIIPKERILTVVIRDTGPFIALQEPVALRSVRITLEDWQVEKLRLKKVASSCGMDHYEQISTCFLEECKGE